MAGGTFYGEPEAYYRSVVLAYSGSECLYWPYGRNSYGYPMLGGEYVSRLVCEAENGAPPTDKHDAAHSCGQGHKGCVARSHLRWATRSENHADKIEHGTLIRGERSNLSKLTAQDVIAIRHRATCEGQKAIASDYGIDQSTVSDIVRGKSWAWLD